MFGFYIGILAVFSTQAIASPAQSLLLLADQASSVMLTLDKLNTPLHACKFDVAPEGQEDAQACSHLHDLVVTDSVVRDLFRHTPDNKIADRGILRNMWQALGEKISSEGDKCYGGRFRRCYPNLRASIFLSELQKLFADFIQDPHLRYGNASGACAYRAEALAYMLAEKGIAAKKMHILTSPSLIAMERNKKGDFSGNYYDYQGAHFLIQVMVNDGGKEVPYLLDPQFMNEPLTRDQYFIRTTGQVCVQKDQAEAKSFLNCTYELLRQNHPSEIFYTEKRVNSGAYASSCGWLEDPLHLSLANMFAEFPKSDGRLNRSNGETPEQFKFLEVNTNSSKELILSAYENYALRLRMDMEMSEQNIQNFSHYGFAGSSLLGDSEDPKTMLAREKVKRAQILRDLSGLANKIEEVKKNLSLVQAN